MTNIRTLCKRGQCLAFCSRIEREPPRPDLAIQSMQGLDPLVRATSERLIGLGMVDRKPVPEGGIKISIRLTQIGYLTSFTVA